MNSGSSWLVLLPMSSGAFFTTPYIRAEINNFPSKYKSLDEDAGTIIMSAHYDSRGSFGSTRHPGADDDGMHSAHTRSLTDQPPASQGLVRLQFSLLLAQLPARGSNSNLTYNLWLSYVSHLPDNLLPLILFPRQAGEEQGLLGSRHYSRESPHVRINFSV